MEELKPVLSPQMKLANSPNDVIVCMQLVAILQSYRQLAIKDDPKFTESVNQSRVTLLGYSDEELVTALTELKTELDLIEAPMASLKRFIEDHLEQAQSPE